MYQKFFQFRESPFQLVPNPAYLYLSKAHEEALAHLSYAIMHGDGFVVITGEVGTGKTTLCRFFLDDIEKDTEAAYIFNPKLDCLQLLKTINDEFEISSEADTIKELIDTLNAFLIAKKSEGKKVILLVDEAQNLTVDVLEQLRLLSNLETSTSKLLQIILVGQPELGNMLSSYSLRQVGQRVTLHYHLTPLSRKETEEYIQHRLHIASNKGTVSFSPGALRVIHKYSRGIPRLINIACDRALLTAYGNNQQTISAAIARLAIKELGSHPASTNSGGKKFGRNGLLVAGSLLAVLLLLVVLYPSSLQWNTFEPSKNRESVSPSQATPERETQLGHELDEPVPSSGETAPPSALIGEEPAPPEAKASPLEEALGRLDSKGTSRAAMLTALQRWAPDAVLDDSLASGNDIEAFFKLASERNGMKLLRVENNFSLIKRLDIPAVLEIYHRGTAFLYYLTLIEIGESTAKLRAGDLATVDVSLQELEQAWTGAAFIPWRDYLSITGAIPGYGPAPSILVLKMLLREIGHAELPLTPVYDQQTENAIKAIQADHGLKKDGVVGTRTKIVLYNLAKSIKTPKITTAGTAGAED